MQYCSYSIGLYFHHQSHPHLGVIFALVPSLILSGVISPWSLVACWAPTDLMSLSFIVLSFAFSYFMGFSRPEYWILCHSLLQWTTFCKNSPPWPAHLGRPYTAWLIVSLTYTRLWSVWWDWLVFCDCGFQSVCPLMEKDKRLMEAYWWGNWVLFWLNGHAQ